MNLEIKRDLVSNWFKTLQNAFCEDIVRIENNKSKFISTSWKRNYRKDEGGGEYRILQNGKVFENFQKSFKKIYLVLKKIQDSGHQEFRLLCTCKIL